MTIYTPRFGMEAPSGATPLRQLGPALEKFARSVDKTLADFDYNGADPGLVLARVAALESMAVLHERRGANAVSCDAATWTELPITAADPLMLTVAAGKPELWEFKLSGIMVGGAGAEARASIELTGATLLGPSAPTWADTLRGFPSSSSQGTITKKMILQPGVTAVRVKGYRTAATGACYANYLSLQATRLAVMS